VPRSFDAGQVIFREGDASDTCYIVRRGHARAGLGRPAQPRSRRYLPKCGTVKAIRPRSPE
jgi:CRP-like cAMP-binding protein